jgi:tetratricopeptide (TPR) repeat protein
VIKPAQANILLTEALVRSAEHRFSDMLTVYKQVIGMDTYISEEARQKLAESVISLRGDETISSDIKNAGFRDTIEQMKAAIAKAPSDARNYLFLMALYNNLPKPEAGSYDEVIRLGKRAVELSPSRPQIYFEIGQAAIALGPTRLEEGIGYFRKAVELNPVPMESHWNLALALAFAGRPAEAEREIDYIYGQERISKISDNNIRNLIAFYEKASLQKNTIRLYRTLFERHPEDLELAVRLAQMYGSSCMLQEARDIIATIVKLKPDEAAGAVEVMRRYGSACAR